MHLDRSTIMHLYINKCSRWIVKNDSVQKIMCNNITKFKHLKTIEISHNRYASSSLVTECFLDIKKGCHGRDHTVIGFATTMYMCYECFSPLSCKFEPC